MNRLLFIFIISQLIPSISFGDEMNCRFQMYEDIPENYNDLPNTYKSKIIAYVDKDGPVTRAQKFTCNEQEYICNIGDILSECYPCAPKEEYGNKYMQITDRYVELCVSGKQNIIETVFNELFNASTDATETGALEPESISAPVFNGLYNTSTNATEMVALVHESISAPILNGSNHVLSTEEKIHLASDETKTKIQNLLAYTDRAIEEIKQECNKQENSKLEKCKDKDKTINYIKNYTIEAIEEMLS